MNIQETMAKLGLDWSVRKEEIQTISGIPVDGAYAIVREDTNKAFHKPMMESYQPFQNLELFELLDKKYPAALAWRLSPAGCLKMGPVYSFS